MVALFGISGVALTNLIWLAILFVAMGVGFSVKYIYKKNYPIRVLIHHDAEGTKRYPLKSEDRARLVSITPEGDKILYLRRHKLFKPFSGTYAGHNTVAYALRSNIWYNVTYTSLDDKLEEIGLEPLDQYHRMTGQAIIVMMDRQFQDPKPSKMIMASILIALLFVAISGYVLYKSIQENKDAASVNLEIVKQQKESQEAWTQNQLNVTQSIARIVAAASQVGRTSGAIPA